MRYGVHGHIGKTEKDYGYVETDNGFIDSGTLFIGVDRVVIDGVNAH